MNETEFLKEQVKMLQEIISLKEKISALEAQVQYLKFNPIFTYYPNPFPYDKPFWQVTSDTKIYQTDIQLPITLLADTTNNTGIN